MNFIKRIFFNTKINEHNKLVSIEYARVSKELKDYPIFYITEGKLLRDTEPKFEVLRREVCIDSRTPYYNLKYRWSHINFFKTEDLARAGIARRLEEAKTLRESEEYERLVDVITAREEDRTAIIERGDGIPPKSFPENGWRIEYEKD